MFPLLSFGKQSIEDRDYVKIAEHSNESSVAPNNPGAEQKALAPVAAYNFAGFLTTWFLEAHQSKSPNP